MAGLLPKPESGEGKGSEQEATAQEMREAIADEAERKVRMSVAMTSPVGVKMAKSGAFSAESKNNEVRKYTALLTAGTVFTKIVGRNSTRRLIWCTPLCDFLCWGEEDRYTVKGALRTTELVNVTQGLGKDSKKLFLSSKNRLLELECKSPAIALIWRQAFEFLIESQQVAKRKFEEMKKDPNFEVKIEKARAEHAHTLQEGEVFKKWPKRNVQGAATIRKLWVDEAFEKLHWGDPANSKSKGFICLGDVVQIQPQSVQPSEPATFTIYAKGRSLDLEAKSTWVREKWMRALRFFVANPNYIRIRVGESLAIERKDSDEQQQ